MQGFVGFDDAALAAMRPGLRLAPALCMIWVAAGTSFALGPLASTAVYETAGEGVVWALCGGLGTLGALLALGADGSIRRRLSPGSPRPA